MPKFTLTLGLTVQVYREIEVEADTPEAAAEAVRLAATGLEHDPQDWWQVKDFCPADEMDTESPRIVEIDDDKGERLFEDVPLTEGNMWDVRDPESLAGELVKARIED